MMQHNELNAKQRQAAEHMNGPLLVLAGAGAGKTRTIAYRIRNLIKNGTAPEQILAITFTNKAAKEMRERVNTLLRDDNDINRPERIRSFPFIATFHALGVHILKEHAQTLNIPRHFTIFDRNDSMRSIKVAIKTAGYDPQQFEPRKILSTISRQKGDAITRSKYEADSLDEYYQKLVAKVWREYEKILKKEKALDFDDLLLQTVELLKKNRAILEQYQNLWNYLHIDEYQDTNIVQSELAYLLSHKHNNICVVGDIDQTIYTWRGARIANLLNFEKQYPDTTIVMLEENYRSTKNIIEASNNIIKKNSNRPEKNLFTNNIVGEKISLYCAYNEIDEAQFITTTAKELISHNTSPNEIAVLYRTNFQSRVLEEAFLEADVPYQVLGVRFFDRKEIKDVLSFIRAALNPESIIDLKRIINIPPRGIGKVTLMRMITGNVHECTPAMKKKIEDFRLLLTKIRECALQDTSSKTVRLILKETGLEKYYLDGDGEDEERLLNIRELVTLAQKYDKYPMQEGIERLLTDAVLATDQDELMKDKRGVKLMTVHAAKGLEFDYVFISGLEDKLFPHEPLDEERTDNEEERRLFYVALTRARKKVFLVYALARTIFGTQKVNTVSEFVTDIDAPLLETENKSEMLEKTIYLQ